MFIQRRTRETIGATNPAKRSTSAMTAALLVLVVALVPFASLTGCSAPQTTTSAADSAQASSETASSTSSAASQQTTSVNEPVETITVNVTVNASAVQEEGWDAYLRGINGPYSLPEGSTVYDALMATEAEVTEEGGYVTAIDGLRTGEFGPSSGWMYSVNDENPFVAANDYQLHDGDSVRWYYSR